MCKVSISSWTRSKVKMPRSKFRRSWSKVRKSRWKVRMPRSEGKNVLMESSQAGSGCHGWAPWEPLEPSPSPRYSRGWCRTLALSETQHVSNVLLLVNIRPYYSTIGVKCTGCSLCDDDNHRTHWPLTIIRITIDHHQNHLWRTENAHKFKIVWF